MDENQLNAMTNVDSNGPLSSDQLKAMLGAAPTHDQSAQALGHSNHLISTILSTGGAIVGGIGGAGLGGLAGIETGPGALATGYAGGVVGAGVGGAAGEALGQAIEQKLGMRPEGVNTGEVAKTGLMNAAFDAVGGPFATVAGKVLQKTAIPVVKTVGSGISKVGEMVGAKPMAQFVSDMFPNSVKIATKRLASTGETMTKREREFAIKEGRMSPGGEYTPSEIEQRAGKIMAGKTYSNPVKTVNSIQQEISKRGKQAETYLEKNAIKIKNEEDFSAFQSARASSEKYMTPSEISAYDEQIGVFQKILKGYATKEEGGYTTANYYKALKDYETQVTANLPKGKDALLTQGGSARIQAAKDVRSVVRDMIGEKNPKFKGKMYDLASLYDSLDNVVAKAEAGGHKFSQRHPFISGAAKTGAGLAGYEAIKKETPLGKILP